MRPNRKGTEYNPGTASLLLLNNTVRARQQYDGDFPYSFSFFGFFFCFFFPCVIHCLVNEAFEGQEVLGKDWKERDRDADGKRRKRLVGGGGAQQCGLDEDDRQCESNSADFIKRNQMGCFHSRDTQDVFRRPSPFSFPSGSFARGQFAQRSECSVSGLRERPTHPTSDPPLPHTHTHTEKCTHVMFVMLCI